MTNVDRALEKVQTLYLMQFQLLDLLDRDLSDPEIRKEVRSQMKEFETLLAKADWRYMGGMDVWETLQNLPSEMSQKLKQSAVSVARSKGGKTKAKVEKVKVKTASVNERARFEKKKK